MYLRRPHNLKVWNRLLTSRFKTKPDLHPGGRIELNWTGTFILNKGNRTTYRYRAPLSKLIFHIISYHYMYSFFIFHLLFDIICYCLSLRLVFIFHVQKKTGSLLLNLLKTSHTAYHPTHIKFSGEILETETTLLDTTVYQCTKRGGGGKEGGSYARICTDIKKNK